MNERATKKTRSLSGASYIVSSLIIICIWELFRSRSVIVPYSSCNTPMYQTSIDTSNNLVQSSYTKYQPCRTEKYVMENAVRLGYASDKNPSGCSILLETNTTNPHIHSLLLAYENEIKNYSKVVKAFEPIPDLLKSIQNTGNHDACSKARLHPNGLQGLFPSNQLSFSASGFVEPLLPPMRTLKVCRKFSALMQMDYLVHDFEFMCRQLKPTSKRVLIDMGASLKFHSKKKTIQPIMSLLKLYEKFGFYFDHIYGFEILYVSPRDIYRKLLPKEYIPSYHWINAGVQSDPESRLNPLHSLVESLDEDDFVVVKLDIDTAWIEVPLARQLLEDLEGKYSNRIDHFYFEHHVHLLELKKNWNRSMNGTIKESLDLFYGLRQKGIPAHFWP